VKVMDMGRGERGVNVSNVDGDMQTFKFQGSDVFRIMGLRQSKIHGKWSSPCMHG